jgi:hypothetical protein
MTARACPDLGDDHRKQRTLCFRGHMRGMSERVQLFVFEIDALVPTFYNVSYKVFFLPSTFLVLSLTILSEASRCLCS